MQTSSLKNCFILVFVFLTGAILQVMSYGSDNITIRHIRSIYSDENEKSLKYPEGVAVCDDSFLAVADTGNSRLLKYMFHEGTLTDSPIPIEIPELPYPIKLKINSKEEILALDGKKRQIARLTSKGQFKGYLSLTNIPPPSAFVPKSFTIDPQDNIYILDIHQERVIVITSSGSYKKQIRFPKTYGFFSDIAIDSKGNIFLVDCANAMIYSSPEGSVRFSPLSHSLKEYLRFPARLAIDNKNKIYVIDRNGGNILILSQNGSFLARYSGHGWKEGLLNHPSQISISKKGDIFIADTSNNRIQMFSLSGI